jgi:hypothetical protein
LDREEIRRLAKAEQSETEMKYSLPEALAAVPYMARMNREYYKELIKQGFTAAQALKLVEAHGMTMQIKGGQ